MASIQIQSDSKLTENGVTYRTVAMTSEKREVSVVVASGKMSYVSVIVQNASHQAWRGNGKQFPTLKAAIDNYQSRDIKAMLGILSESAIKEKEDEAIAEIKPAKKIRTYGFDRYKMSQHLTLEELTALRQQVEADPKSQNLRKRDINLYAPAARKKLDNIAWVITWKLAALRAQRGEPVPTNGYSGRNCNRS